MRAFLLFILFGWCSGVLAQAGTGSYTFIALDFDLNPIPNVEVTVRNTTLSTVNRYQTDLSGEVNLPHLLVGAIYLVSMSAPDRNFDIARGNGSVIGFAAMPINPEQAESFVYIFRDLPDAGEGPNHPFTIRAFVHNTDDPGAALVLTDLTDNTVIRFGIGLNQRRVNVQLNNLIFEHDYQIHIESDNFVYRHNQSQVRLGGRVARFSLPPREQAAQYEFFQPNRIINFTQVDGDPVPGEPMDLTGTVQLDNAGIDHPIDIIGLDNNYQAMVFSDRTREGQYLIRNLNSGTYTVTPQAHPEYFFQPMSRTVEVDALIDLWVEGVSFRAVRYPVGQVSGRVTGACTPADNGDHEGICLPEGHGSFPIPRAQITIRSCRSDNARDCRLIPPEHGPSQVQADNNGNYITPTLPGGLYEITVDTDLDALNTVYNNGHLPDHLIEWGAIRPNGQVSWGTNRQMIFVQQGRQNNWNFHWRLRGGTERQQGLTAESSTTGFGSKAAKLQLQLKPEPAPTLNLPKGFGSAVLNDDDKADRLIPAKTAEPNASLKLKQRLFKPSNPDLTTRVITKNPETGAKLSRLEKKPKTDFSKKLSINVNTEPAVKLKLDLNGPKKPTKPGDNLIINGYIRNVSKGITNRINWYLIGNATRAPGKQDRLQKGTLTTFKGMDRKNLSLKFTTKIPGKWHFQLCAEHQGTSSIKKTERTCSAIVKIEIKEPINTKSVSKSTKKPTLTQLKAKPKSNQKPKINVPSDTTNKQSTKKDSKQTNLLVKPKLGNTPNFVQ